MERMRLWVGYYYWQLEISDCGKDATLGRIILLFGVCDCGKGCECGKVVSLIWSFVGNTVCNFRDDVTYAGVWGVALKRMLLLARKDTQ